MNNEIIFLKKKQRESSIKIRKKLYQNNNYILDPKLIDALFNNKNLSKFKIISSFFSVNTEISTKGLNKYLIESNKILLFPSINKSNKLLTFRKSKKYQNLIKGDYNIPEPPKKNKELLPEILFVPCLAFDDKGYRLGYGGGYYDKTFAHFKSINHKFISIGFAYDAQKTELLTIDKFDYKLNFVLTEKQLYSF